MTTTTKQATEIQVGDLVALGDKAVAVVGITKSFRKHLLRLVLEGVGGWDVVRDQEIYVVA